jgi:protein TonB
LLEVLAHPLYRENPEPEYPALARRRQQEGTVVIEALVTPEGKVGGLALRQSSGHPLLDEAALKGVKGWRFEPGRRGAVAVAMKVLVPVRFGLR